MLIVGNGRKRGKKQSKQGACLVEGKLVRGKGEVKKKEEPIMPSFGEYSTAKAGLEKKFLAEGRHISANLGKKNWSRKARRPTHTA